VVRKRRCFVLVDAIVATVLLAASLLTIMAMVSRAMTSQRQGERLEVAAMLLDEQLNLVLARGPDNYARRFPIDGACPAPYQEYSYRLEFSGGTGGDAYLVTATVSWVENGRGASESVQTRIAPRRGDDPDPERKPEEPVVRF
jgi:Tfp pilus assembly protein PilV